jgi:transcriptional regulator with XRE-family HTH domain
MDFQTLCPMPKKPKIEYPLRKLRLITGKSQGEFARLLGCSPSTIKQIEAGNHSKLNVPLLINLAAVFAVNPESIFPPSSEPKVMDGKPYTKEFFEEWWKNGPKIAKPDLLSNKECMVRDLEMVLAAAMRAPGMVFYGVHTSFYIWLIDLMNDGQFWPHHEAELKERFEKAKNCPNKFESDWEMARLFREDKSKFLQGVFESDLRETTLVKMSKEKKKGDLEKELPDNLDELPKTEKLKAQAGFFPKMYKKIVQTGKVPI